MVDLKTQYERLKGEIDPAIQQVIDSSAFINGPEVKTFQKELQNYLHVKHVIPCANGTDALQISMMALGLQPGDEVITPDFTFIATIEVIVLLGLKPVFVDIAPDTFTIDPEEVQKAITNKTRAIVPVHLFGQCADMDSIMSIARQHNLHIIEDVAQATGAEHISADMTRRKAGTIGNIGCTSFFPSKTLACFGDGGALMTDDDILAEKLSMIVNHGSKKKYFNDSIGVNSRLDTIQAAILLVKLKYLDDFNRARQTAAGFYDEAFRQSSVIKIPVRASWSTHVYHQYTLRLHDNINREEMQKYLKSRGIPTMIYYPVAMHRQKAYRQYSPGNRSLKVTQKLCDTVLSLPIHTEMGKDQLEYITDHVMEYTENKPAL